MLKSLTLAAGLALTATHAFVLLPDVSQADTDIVNALPFDAAVAAQSQTVKLDCPGCPVQMKKLHAAGYGVATDMANHLELTFAVDTESAKDRLLVNDFEIYPKSGAWYSVLRAPQVLDFTGSIMKHPAVDVASSDTPHLGYSLSIRPVVKEEDGQQLELVDIDLQVIEVGNNFVDGIPNINIKLIKTPTGKLMIAQVQTTESQTAKVPNASDGKSEDCATLYCQWRAAVIEQLKRVHGFKKCAKGMRHGGPHGQHRGHGHGHGGPHGKMHGGPNDQFRHHHTWGQLFKNITSGILLPVFIGLVAGVSISIIGMLVGTFVICLWRVFVRRESPFARRRCCRRHAAHKAQREAAVTEEKAALMADEDVADLPLYKDDDDENKTAQS